MRKKRLAVYFLSRYLHDADWYKTVFMKELKSVSEELILVVGQESDIHPELELYAGKIMTSSQWVFQREKYQDWLSLMGKYEELILCDETFMGPLYPFAEMFAEMEERGAEVWNILPRPGSRIDGFLVMGKETALNRTVFEQFLCEEKTAFREFEKEYGCGAESYLFLEDYAHLTDDPAMMYPVSLIQQQKCPVFDYSIFYRDFGEVMQAGDGMAAAGLYRYLEDTGLFDLDILWDKLLREVNQADLVKNLQLFYTLSGENPVTQAEKERVDRKKTALVMHLYYPELLENSYRYALAMPDTADIYITTDTDEKKKAAEKVFSGIGKGKCEVRVIENRGRDVSSLLVGAKDIVGQYDYICFVHDKKTTQITPGSIGEKFAFRCMENTLHNQNYVYHLIDRFEKNPRMGLLSPAAPNHASYFPTLGQEWGVNFENTKKLAGKLNFHVPICEEKEPAAPFGTCFWFRVKAMKPLFDFGWEYGDFPKEPNGTDGTLLHAVERIYPYAVQEAGYYPAFVLEQSFAEAELTNFQYYIRGYNHLLLKYGIGGDFPQMLEGLEKVLNGGEKAPVHQILKQYADAFSSVSGENERIRQEIANLRDAYDGMQKSYEDMRKAHDRVNEEWRKTAEALKVTQDALGERVADYMSLEEKYRKTIRGFIEQHAGGKKTE